MVTALEAGAADGVGSSVKLHVLLVPYLLLIKVKSLTSQEIFQTGFQAFPQSYQPREARPARQALGFECLEVLRLRHREIQQHRFEGQVC